ncbi:transcriptional regulator, AsnC family [Haloplanus vescus]|uniref:Transcriptional regulator, AsnC family n=1 Tax=Haloplanus vescus TaxID=555874 RepID=A0A1H3VVR3_9EURY|nr:Lrp/AsnC family transcriptional regulator [Haloplanus vescus]SDZ78913.1 transcriptional regulator, AsnC family [Haloplanus vescus]
MDYRVDEIDKRILYYLTADARNTSAPMIADEMDVSAGTIRNRIGQLEEHGLITGYHADVDYERVEDRLVNLYICTAPVSERGRLAKRALDITGVVNVRQLMAGKRNLHITGIGTDTQSLSHIAGEISSLGLEIEEESILQWESTQPYEPFGPEDGSIGSSIADFVSLTGGAEVTEVSVGDGAEIAGKTLSEADNEGILSGDVLVVGIERDDEVLTPKGDTEILPGDIVTLFSPDQTPQSILDVFSGPTEPVA